MRKAIYMLAIVVALGFAAPAAMGASVEAHGQCEDDGSGGGGSVGADSSNPGGADAVDAAEVQSIASGLAAFATGQADETSGQESDGNACDASDDDDGDGTETSSEEDHIAASASAQGESAGACFDNDGQQLHGTSDCHDAPH